MSTMGYCLEKSYRSSNPAAVVLFSPIFLNTFARRDLRSADTGVGGARAGSSSAVASTPRPTGVFKTPASPDAVVVSSDARRSVCSVCFSADTNAGFGVVASSGATRLATGLSRRGDSGFEVAGAGAGAGAGSRSRAAVSAPAGSVRSLANARGFPGASGMDCRLRST